MTTPVRGKSLTTIPRGEVPVATPTPPPPPIIPPTPTAPKGPSAWRRFRRWVMGQRGPHPWIWWTTLVAICLISLRILIAAMATWPVFRGYILFGGFFWFTCIGMTPMLAIYRTGINFMEEIFDGE